MAGDDDPCGTGVSTANVLVLEITDCSLYDCSVQSYSCNHDVFFPLFLAQITHVNRQPSQ